MIFLLPIAFISGILTVFSPCALPILPIILASSIDGNTKRVKGIIIGLIISFTISSLLLATIVRTLGVSADTIRLGAVGLLILLGLSLVFPYIWQKVQDLIEKNWKLKPIQNKNKGFLNGIITGISLGIVWTPCVGPIIATVATIAAVSALSLSAVFIALSYALGIGLALFFVAKGSGAVSKKLNIVKKQGQKIRQIFGIVVLLTAFFIWTGADRSIQAWTLNSLPRSWTQLATTFEKRFNVDSQLKKIKQKTMKNTNSKTIIIKNIALQNDFRGAKVNKQDLIQGCPAKDCIPSINNPKFESVASADKWLNPDDRIFGIVYKGAVRAYPQKIMNWHEIVNDNIKNTPIAITFCPLCGSALAFERKVNGVITEFGVSGKLHNSDLVMYDRYEGNLWQQITGEAIVGPASRRNETLIKIPIITVKWSKWKKENPNTQILSRNTGYLRNYDFYPYGTYEKDNRLLFGIKGLNTSLPIKEIVYGIEIEGKYRAYPKKYLTKSK